MGFFDLKATCSYCNKEVGLTRFKTADGWLCPSCYKLCSPTLRMAITKKTIAEIRQDISPNTNNSNVEQLQKLAELRKDGLLDENEFENEKKKLIESPGISHLKQQAKKTFNKSLGGLIAIGIIIVVMILINVLPKETAASKQQDAINNLSDVTDVQKAKITAVLAKCRINHITTIEYNKKWQNGFTNGEKAPNVKEDGYDIVTSYSLDRPLILFLRKGNVLGVSFGSIDLYKKGKVLHKLSDLVITEDEKVNAELDAINYVKKSLKAPSTAKFPSYLPEDNDDWKIWKEKGVVYVQSYVDAENSFGAKTRSQFQLKIIKGNVVSFIFDGEEMIK